jgi:LacI family transcriptional regulator
MRDVALAAGVSVSTVANVLSRPRVVADGTRRRVEQAIADVGYVPGGAARPLRGAPSPIVGCIVLDLANPFYAELNRGVEDRLAEIGGLLLVCSTDLQPEREGQLLRLLEEQAVRGIIISPTAPDLGPLLALHRRGTPVVLVDSPPGGADLCAVAVDHGLGGRLAAEHLTALGHRRIAFVTGAEDPTAELRRRSGLRAGLQAAGLDPAEALLDARVPLQTRKPLDEAAATVAQLLAARPRPTAIACVNDAAAITVLEVLDRAGLRVPDDMSVLGYDDLPFSDRLAPALTTIAQPKRELGVTAAELLLAEAEPGHVHREVWFEPALVVRASTGPVRSGL